MGYRHNMLGSWGASNPLGLAGLSGNSAALTALLKEKAHFEQLISNLHRKKDALILRLKNNRAIPLRILGYMQDRRNVSLPTEMKRTLRINAQGLAEDIEDIYEDIETYTTELNSIKSSIASQKGGTGQGQPGSIKVRYNQYTPFQNKQVPGFQDNLNPGFNFNLQPPKDAQKDAQDNAQKDAQDNAQKDAQDNAQKDKPKPKRKNSSSPWVLPVVGIGALVAILALRSKNTRDR